MSNNRANIFDAAPDLDVSGFEPKSKVASETPAPSPEEVRAVSEAANFHSRSPAKPSPARKLTPPPASKRVPRRYRTGRNIQLNLKVSQETVDAFYSISDGQNWVLGETLERALAALKRELAKT